MNKFKKEPLPRNSHATLSIEETKKKYYAETEKLDENLKWQVQALESGNFVDVVASGKGKYTIAFEADEHSGSFSVEWA